MLEEELELLLELESKLEVLELESKADEELESKEELKLPKPDPPDPPNPPDPPDPPDPPRLAKLVGGARLLVDEEMGRPVVEVEPKSKLEESRVEPKEL